MDEPINSDQGQKSKDPLIDKENKIFKRNDPFWSRSIEIISAALLLIGIVLSFFYEHLGSMFAGLGFGLCFFKEIIDLFRPREYYSEQGFFKTLMWVGTILYFLISIPAFVIAAAIGCAGGFLLRWTLKK